MCRCVSQPWYLLLFVAIALAAYLFTVDAGLPATTDREAMIGTWTDPTGEPGNSIRFYTVPVKLPTSPLVGGLEGRATAVGMLGQNRAEATWNYGSFDPLVLNINVGTISWFAAVRKLDNDHILIRFGRDPAEMMQPGAIDHPATKRLTQIGR